MSRRVISLALALALAGGGTAAARAVHPATLAAPAAARLTLASSAAVPVCPGPQTLLAPAGGAAIATPAPVVVGALAAAAATLDGPGAPAGPATPPVATLGAMHLGQDGPPSGAAPLAPNASGAAVGVLRPKKPGPLRLDVRGAGGLPAVAASQLWLARTGDLRGLVAVACAAAGTDTWLVGGGTQTGRRARLLLANPTPAPAVVDLTVHGPNGPVAAAGGAGIVVPPGAEKAIFVDALAPGLAAIAVHVRARTGRVVAGLLDSLLRGLTPGGADAVMPSAPAGPHQVVTGLSLATPADPSGGDGTSAPAGPVDATAAGAAAVRVVVPGTRDAVVRIHLIGLSGEVNVPGGGVVTVPGGAVRDVALAGVPDGEYAAVVDADVPVLAGGLVGRSVAGSAAAGTQAALGTTVPPAELAWAPASVPLRGTTALSLPALPTASVTGDGAGAPTRRLVLAAPAAAGRVVLAQVGSDGSVGQSRLVAIPASGVQVVDLDPATVGLLVRPDPGVTSPVNAAVLLEAADSAGPLVSVLPISSPAVESVGIRTAREDPEVGLR